MLSDHKTLIPGLTVAHTMLCDEHSRLCDRFNAAWWPPTRNRLRLQCTALFEAACAIHERLMRAARTPGYSTGPTIAMGGGQMREGVGYTSKPHIGTPNA